MSDFYLYDDQRARTFEPFASTRPVSELVAGAILIRERWRTALQPDGEPRFLAGARHRTFEEPGAARAAAGTIPAGAIVANARCAPAVPDDIREAGEQAEKHRVWRCGDRVAAVRLTRDIDAAAFEDGSVELESLAGEGDGATATLDGWWHDEVWDFIRHLPAELTSDITQFAKQGYAQPATLPAHVTVLGDQPVFVLGEATLEPHVVLDASAGPIMIQSGAHVRAFTRITGPCYIGRDVQVMGGDITGCSIGDVCKVRGELSSTIFLGHANKGHDGFVGHSYLGRWVNVGAGTITSNLKNTYGTVALWTPSGVRDTGMQFLGTLFGDHVKTGIGLRLTTGTVLGAGANVYGNMPPKAVAPFSWGDAPPYAEYRADKFLETAARMMARRHVELSARARQHLTAVHAERWTLEAVES
jgi:UDP-N-acetylglucosamine diphosphorylase/glucosamine-1-phosphate N-acetyltransferase